MEEREFYHGMIYRPPTEANSLIVQTTWGCSHNKCTYCSMYRAEDFRIKPLQDVLDDFDYARKYIRYVPSIFLADADALVRKSSDQIAILEHIRKVMPECRRVTTYAYPRNILTKTVEDLKKFRELGLVKVYLGLESGDDEVLRMVNKGVTAEEIYRACMMVKEAGIELSCLAIVGLGGRERWEQHAINTGKLLTRIHPDIIGANMLMLKEPSPMRDDMLAGKFTLPEPMEMLQESKLLLQNLDCEGTKYVSTHVSNYVPLQGYLNRDKELFIHRIDKALQGQIRLTPEWMRRN